MLGMRFQPFLTDTSSLQIWFNIFPVEALAMYGGYYPPPACPPAPRGEATFESIKVQKSYIGLFA